MGLIYIIEIVRALLDNVCSRCKQMCPRNLDAMKSCDLILTYIRTHRNSAFRFAAAENGIVDTHQVKKRTRSNGVRTIANPTREEAMRILAHICKRYHDKLFNCDNCPIDQALIDMNVKADTYKLFYEPYFCDKKRREK